MKFEKLEEIGRAMSAEETAADLRSLCNDRRFAAVLNLIRHQKTVAADESAQLKFANNPGCLAHAGGVRYGMIELEGQIRMACERPKRRGEQRPPPGNDE